MNTTSRNSFILLLIFRFCIVLVCGLSEGDQCSTSTSEQGVCTIIPDCPQIQNDLRNGKLNHVVCGHKEFARIVCCPINAEVTTSTALLTSARISARKCNEYKEFAYNSDTPMKKKLSNCVFAFVPLIVGGNEAKQGEFPHMALIGFNDGNTTEWLCGGTLISDQFVLTAAHCLDTPVRGQPKYVRLGEHDLERTDDGSTIDLNIIQIIAHPEYRHRIQYNDIGLLKLERKIQFNGAIRPACLPEYSAVPTRKAIATGWGTVEFSGERSNILLKVILDIFSQSECSSSYATEINRKLSRGILEESQVCAGSYLDEKDTCQGDAGGPLQTNHEKYHCTYTIVGVTSFGKACGTVGVPAVFTRVYAYLDWIEGIVWPYE